MLDYDTDISLRRQAMWYPLKVRVHMTVRTGLWRSCQKKGICSWQTPSEMIKNMQIMMRILNSSISFRLSEADRSYLCIAAVNSCSHDVTAQHGKVSAGQQHKHKLCTVKTEEWSLSLWFWLTSSENFGLGFLRKQQTLIWEWCLGQVTVQSFPGAAVHASL